MKIIMGLFILMVFIVFSSGCTTINDQNGDSKIVLNSTRMRSVAPGSDLAKIVENAIASSNSELCKQAQSYEFNGGDFIEIVSKADAENQCLYFYAINKLDYSICQKLPDYERYSDRANCFGEIVKKTNDPSICPNYFDTYSFEWYACMAGLANPKTMRSSCQGCNIVKSFTINDSSDARLTKPYIYDNIVYFGSSNGHLYAFNYNNNNLAWKFKTEGAIETSPIVYDGIVYFGSWDNSYYALDANNGTEIWKFKSGGPYNSDPVVSGNKIFFTSGDGYAYALDTKTGRDIWKFKNVSWASTPIISGNNVYVINDDSLYILDTTSGNIKSTIFLNQISSYDIDVNNSIIYYGNYDRFLIAFDISNNKELWRFKTEDPATPVFSGGVIYSAGSYKDSNNYEHYLYAFDASTGQIKWKFTTSSQIYTTSVIGGNVYFATLNDYMYSLNKITQKQNYLFKTFNIFTEPNVLDDLVFVGSDGTLYIISNIN